MPRLLNEDCQRTQDNWIKILQALNAFAGYRRVLSGHGEPTDRSALDATVAYLRKGKEAYAAARSPTAYADIMKAAFPERRHPDWIDVPAALLYGAIDAYDAPPGALTNDEFITG